MTIRPYTPADLPALYTINQASRPGVSHEASAEALGELIALGTCLVAVDRDDRPEGFVNLVEPGTAAYGSQNLRWLERWMAEQNTDMLYVDRVAVAAAARHRGLGSRLYEAAFARARGRQRLTCEVNTDPDNPGSHRFHQRHGFVRIGELRHSEEYAVAFYAREV